MRRLLRRWADAELIRRNDFLRRQCIRYHRAYLREVELREQLEAVLREARDDA